MKPDKFTMAMVITLLAATFLPAQGEATGIVDIVGRCSIFLLFFLHGANLSSKATIEGLGHWRFPRVVLVTTLALFPPIGLGTAYVGSHLLDSSLNVGLLFLCCLPSTVQSSIAYTSIAKGNVPAAVCAASASNVIGVFATPALVGLLLARHSEISFASLQPIVTIILLPFILGQLLRPWIGGWLARHKTVLSLVDRGSILIMVYSAFGKAVTNGIWSTVTLHQLGLVLVFCFAILAIVMALTDYGAHLIKLSEEDRPAAIFCGSMKSLVTGVPMAVILFPPQTAGAVVLPLMIYHQLQLLVCAWVARRFQRQRESDLDRLETEI